MKTHNIQDPVSAQRQSAPHTIFRPDAVRRHTQPATTTVLPGRLAMHTIIAVWVVFGLLLVATAGVWMARVPIYLFGTAIIVTPASPPHGPELVAFLPASARTQLAAGQRLLVQLEAGSTFSSHTITVVEPTIISPEVAQRRYTAGSVPPVSRPAAVAIAPLAPREALTAAPAPYGHYSVKVVVGTRSLLSFLPLFGRPLSGEQQ